jgi:hypothetical protein
MRDAMTVADDLAPYISFFNLLGFAACLWLLVRVRRSTLAPYLSGGSWVLVVGTGIHAVNDYVSPVVNFTAFQDDAYDHLFIHVALLVAVILYALGLARLARSGPPATLG